MKHIRYSLILITAILFSCSDDLIPQKDMPAIIAEIYMADRYVTSDYKLVLKADTIKIYDAVFNKYGYTSEQYVKTINHYISRPVKLKEFYSKAREILVEQEQEISAFLDSKSLDAQKAFPYKKLTEEADEIKEYDSYERALRWILAPEISPALNVSAGDSLSSLYETPDLVKWWINNFKDVTKKFRMILKDEKNRSTIHIPSELIESDIQRNDNPGQ